MVEPTPEERAASIVGMHWLALRTSGANPSLEQWIATEIAQAKASARAGAFEEAIKAARARRTRSVAGFSGEGHARNLAIEDVIADLEELHGTKEAPRA